MFSLAKFIISNLKSGYQNDSFTEEQINIFALNYLNKGQISQEDFDNLQEFLYPPETGDED